MRALNMILYGTSLPPVQAVVIRILALLQSDAKHILYFRSLVCITHTGVIVS